MWVSCLCRESLEGRPWPKGPRDREKAMPGAWVSCWQTSKLWWRTQSQFNTGYWTLKPEVEEVIRVINSLMKGGCTRGLAMSKWLRFSCADAGSTLNLSRQRSWGLSTRSLSSPEATAISLVNNSNNQRVVSKRERETKENQTNGCWTRLAGGTKGLIQRCQKDA